MAATTDPEIKSGFTWKYFALTAIVAVLSATLGFASNYLFALLTEATKEVLVSISSSGNLATVPVNVANNIEISPESGAPSAVVPVIEVYLTLPNAQKQLIKSLFKYDVTITNTSKEGIDDFWVYISVPPEISLIAQPSLTSTPAEIIHTIRNEPVETAPNKQVYKINLLNQGQSLTYSYFAFANQLIDFPYPLVTVQKKDWMQNVVTQPASIPFEIRERNQSQVLIRLLSVLMAFMTVMLVGLTVLYASRTASKAAVDASNAARHAEEARRPGG